MSLQATHLKTNKLGKTSGRPTNQLNHTTMLDHSKTKLSSRRGSAQASNLKFHLTCTSDDEQSLERIHTFNLKTTTTASFDAKQLVKRSSKLETVMPQGLNVTTTTPSEYEGNLRKPKLSLKLVMGKQEPKQLLKGENLASGKL